MLVSVKRRTGLLLIIPHCLQRIGGKRKKVTKLITAGAKVIAPQEAKATTERNAIIKKECQEADGAAAYHSSLPAADRREEENGHEINNRGRESDSSAGSQSDNGA